jgi:hypothetical protein
MKKKTIGKQILSLLVAEGHLTLGDIMRRLRLPAGTAAFQRMSELRKVLGEGSILCYRCKVTGRYRYFVNPAKKDKARKFLEVA